MLRLDDISDAEFRQSLVDGAFRLRVGSFSIRVGSVVPELRSGLRAVYGRYPISISGGYYDYDLEINPPATWRRWLRRNALFSLSGQSPFLPMPAAHSHALFEWGLNWTIGSSAHQYLILHSAVVEKDGKCILMPALSGSGKSTLTAELVNCGWRLFSDELALLDGPELKLIPFPRPVSLKNESIELIRRRHPSAEFGPQAQDTLKGTIVHMRAPDDSVDRANESVPPALIVFPKWGAQSELSVTPIGAGQAAMRLIDQSFNYHLLGQLGYSRLADLVCAAKAWDLEFSALEDAVGVLDDLIADDV